MNVPKINPPDGTGASLAKAVRVPYDEAQVGDAEDAINATQDFVTRSLVDAEIGGIKKVIIDKDKIEVVTPKRNTSPPLRVPNLGLVKRPEERLTSKEKLESLGMDPLAELVKLHDRLELIIDFQENCRDGIVNGKFSPEYYHRTLDLLQKTNADLLRYGYARVSETVQIENKTPQAFTIELTTPETYIRGDISDAIVTEANGAPE